MITVVVLIFLITLTSQLVHSKVITVNITSGNSSHECCYTEQGCLCASLSVALQYIDSNTTINITSSSVMLEESVKLGSNRTSGSGNLTDIAITGSNVTIMCNNSGSVYCESCDNVMIEGITWDRCGDPNGTNIAWVTFDGTSNISLVNCTFQLSQILAVTFLDVSENVTVNHCNFLSNRRTIQLPIHCECGSLGIHCSSSNFVDLIVSDSYFYDNGFHCNNDIDTLGYVLNVFDTDNLTTWNVAITRTRFFSNLGAANFLILGNCSIQLTELALNNNDASNSFYPASLTFELYGNSTVAVHDSLFIGNIAPIVNLLIENADATKILISNSTFTSNQDGLISLFSSVSSVEITLVGVEVSHNVMSGVSDAFGIILFSFNYKAVVNLTKVRLISNRYLGDLGGAVYIRYDGSPIECGLTCTECEFFNNTSILGAAFYIDNYSHNIVDITIVDSKIHHNVADDTVVYLNNMGITLISSDFTNNIGSSMSLLQSTVNYCDNVTFANNSADNGAALYLDQNSVFHVYDDMATHFINNSAVEHGGAIYINLDYNCPHFPFVKLSHFIQNSLISFENNTARISGNSLYFYVPKHCIIVTNISDGDSILYIPCQFNYSQPVNGKVMHIPCDLDYKLLNGTGAPIATSPLELRLYFPFNAGYIISTTSDHNAYFVTNSILRYPVKFTGNVFGYFGKPTEPTQFDVQCVNCSSSVVLPEVHFLVDNITSLSITFTGTNIQNRINVTVMLTSAVHSIKEINTTLIVELMPCIDHPGYTYNTAHKACMCYHDNVDCHENYNEIKKGYWFGSVSNTATTAPCPHYCNFIGRTETRQGYFELPNTIDGQCSDHRVGRACGECSSGYTLSYDSIDCISVDQCGAGWTVLVITLTCLYWIAVVAGVFALMYFKFQISLGHLYGLIYYYSIIHILLDSYPYLSGGVLQFASVLLSFAQLTPQFLGKLCFVKGLSRVDQLFIHYSHAVGVSLLLLLIVVAAKWSTRVTLFVSRCIIRVICLLILLSYTSIVSTSLQLLRPIKFTDVKEWYAYTSPNIQYFHGRHAVYGVVAIICELVVGIGLPLLLLLQPFLNRKISFIRIKPLLDQFQGCYKDEYRWFAAYYLICRQVISLIAFSFSSNYYDTAFYLQAACVVIASFHTWIQPYKSALLNGLDGVILLLMILTNSYVYMNSPLTTLLGIITILLPLILFCAIFIRKSIKSCRKKNRRYCYVNINSADIDDGVAAEENIIRYVLLCAYLFLFQPQHLYIC